jgi:maltokinase
VLTPSNKWVCSIAPRLPEPLDALDLTDGSRLAIVTDTDGLSALPQVRDPDGCWRRARPGDGAGEALLDLLVRTQRPDAKGRFMIQSWTERTASGERAIGVDQTNESIIVGESAVVKWATHLQEGPHPAPRRISILRDAGFGGMPSPWGLVTWRPPDGAETLVVSVDEYLPRAVDGWTWAVELITAAAQDHAPGQAVDAATEVGIVVADLHAALACTATTASLHDSARWRDTAMKTLETVCTLDDSASVEIARARRDEIEDVLNTLGTLTGTPVIEGHGDLHVGQVLRVDGRFVVTDFDGNPVLTAQERMLPIPTILDVAGMAQSLAHTAIVARKYAPLDPAALAEADDAVRAAFLGAYADRIAHRGHADLYDPAPSRAFRMQQVLREIIYAARHLPRWMYVPDVALPALLDEGAQS